MLLAELLLISSWCMSTPPWQHLDSIAWDPYAEAAGNVELCIERQMVNHYGWASDWVTLECISSDRTLYTPEIPRWVYPAYLRYRIVAVKSYIPEDCTGEPRYCTIFLRSPPSPIVCGRNMPLS